MFNASKGGKRRPNILVKFIINSFHIFLTKSKINEKLWLKKYIIRETRIVNIFDIKVEKKKTRDSKISSLKKVNSRENEINLVISISLINNTIKNNKDWKNIIKNTVIENHKNFHNINSYLLIGLLNIKKMVFHSISLKRSWEPINKTHTKLNISIIASPKSTIILLSSQIVNFQSNIEKIIKINAKNNIR